MSIDIFGHHSKQAGNSSRGPPGIGFMVTSEGNFGIDGKRLCNVAKEEQPNDAVNLQLVQYYIQKKLIPSMMLLRH